MAAKKKGIGQDLWDAEKKVLKTTAKVLLAPGNAGVALRKKVFPTRSEVAAKSAKADSARKTKEAQATGMGKVKAVKSAGADTKRKTAEAKTFPPAKKAPSSYALGLRAKPGKPTTPAKREESTKKKKGML
jgi:hypothetical protein